MSSIRSELWCAAFVRRQNDLGRICVLSRRGDPIAGQVWIEIDHLDGTASLFSPAPSLAIDKNSDEWAFICRFDRAPSQKVTARLGQEVEFDPDFWLISVESRTADLGLNIVKFG